MFCEKCGTQIADTESFCPNCGAQQSVANASAPVYGAPAAPAASTFKLYDILVFVAIALMAIGTLLPLFSANVMGRSIGINSFGAISGLPAEAMEYMGASESINMNFGGIWIILIAIAIAALYLFNKEKIMVILAAFSAGILAPVKGIFYSALIMFASDKDHALGLGIGFWMMLIGAIGAAVLPFTPLAAERGFYLKR